MLFPDKSRQHQNLTQYLREASRRRGPTVDVAMPPIALAVVSLVFAAVLGVQGGLWALLAVAAAALVVLLPMLARKPKREPTARERLAQEARPVIQSMLAHAESKRLHREMDPATLALLEECARLYWQVQAVFASPFWVSPGLPVSYQGLREQALRAAEMTMDELMLLYRNYLPEKPKGQPAIEFVQEALEQFVFKKAENADFLPPLFEPTRQIAEKLQLLAVEADRVSRDLWAETSVPELGVPGGALDASIGDLRTIRQAEEELRQNLGGG